MNRTSKCMLAAAVLAVAADGFAQDQMQSPTVHAKRGQSSAQQARDADSCTAMARKRTGVDPTVLAANSTPLQEGKGLTIQPIDQPTMAMGSSGGGATGAGTGDMSQGGQMGNAGQMGSSGAGATGSSGQMNNPEAGAMGSSGAAGTGATGSSAMGSQSAGGTGAAGMSGSSSASADMGSSGSSGAMGSTGASGAAGSSGHAMASSGSSGSTGTTGKGHPAGKSHGKLAMVTADDYNTAFSKCMSSRGYMVESSSASGN